MHAPAADGDAGRRPTDNSPDVGQTRIRSAIRGRRGQNEFHLARKRGRRCVAARQTRPALAEPGRPGCDFRLPGDPAELARDEITSDGARGSVVSSSRAARGRVPGSPAMTRLSQIGARPRHKGSVRLDECGQPAKLRGLRRAFERSKQNRLRRRLEARCQGSRTAVYRAGPLCAPRRPHHRRGFFILYCRSNSSRSGFMIQPPIPGSRGRNK